MRSGWRSPRRVTAGATTATFGLLDDECDRLDRGVISATYGGRDTDGEFEVNTGYATSNRRADRNHPPPQRRRVDVGAALASTSVLARAARHRFLRPQPA